MALRVDRRITNHRAFEEWYECAQCGFNYPRHKVSVQNGAILCFGPNTTDCQDLPGHGAALRQMDIPREKAPEPLPDIYEDL